MPRLWFDPHSEADPIQCRKCGSVMKIIASIEPHSRPLEQLSGVAEAGWSASRLAAGGSAAGGVGDRA